MTSAKFWDMLTPSFPLSLTVAQSCKSSGLSSCFVLPPSQCVHHLCMVLKLKRPMHSLSVMRELFLLDPVEASAKRLWPGLVDFVPAIAYHFCLALPCLQHSHHVKEILQRDNFVCVCLIMYFESIKSCLCPSLEKNAANRYRG